MKNKIFKIFFALMFLVVLVINQGFIQAQEDGADITIGKYRVLHSNIMDEDRLLFVHLPRGYEDTQLSYPVLCLLYVDVYNYYLDAASIIEKLGSTGEIPPMIIVGVANTNRYRDLLPVKTRYRSEGGGADNFLRFIEEELIPYVDNNYRTKNFRILAGPQTASILSLYSLISKPTLFNALISENPFMDPVNADFLFPMAESFFTKTTSLKNFLYIKCEKNERPQDLEYVENFAKLLESNKPEGFRFKLEIREPSGYFTTPLPFSDGLRMFFPGHKLPENFQTNTVRDIIDYYEKLSEEYGFAVDPPSLMMTFEGDKLSEQRKTKEAIALFEYQLSLYPKSLNAFWRLGETYRGMGDFEKAGEYYRKFLDIEDTDAAMIWKRLNQVERIIKESASYCIEQAIDINGIKAGMKKYQEIKSDPENILYFDENEFNAMGYRLMGKEKKKEAIEIFNLNVELHPESANAYDSLGEAYMHAGDVKNAIKNYKKSLELNPDNDNAKEMLKKLEKERDVSPAHTTNSPADNKIEAVAKVIEGQRSPGITPQAKIPGSCTIFAASFGNTALYGNNEDYRIPKTYYWTEPSGEKAYGGVFLGFDNFFPQGGINEKGLAFDFNALPEAPLNPHTELPGRGDIIKKIYQTCASVEEAIALAKKHNWGSSLKWQVLLADATGDAVVISAGMDGELAFSRKPKGDGYLVSTNFNRANPKNTYRGSYPCWRYNKAVEMLEKIKDEKGLTVDYFKSILDACHVEGPGGNTLYSNVFDLKNGVIYLYHWHQFYETAVLKVADEIAKKQSPTRIQELFSHETVKRAEDEYQRYKKKE